MAKAKNFFMVSNNIFSFELKPRDFIVYCCLLKHSDNKEKSCFPSRKTIAKECVVWIRKRLIVQLKVLRTKDL